MNHLSILVCSAVALFSAPAPGAACASTVTAPTVQEPQKRPPRPVRVDYTMVKRLFGMDPTVEAVDNPTTPAKVALGKLLYHEQSLSADGSQSCASCHDLTKYGVSGRVADGARNTPSTWNAFRQFAQTWDGRAKNVEELAGQHGLPPEAELVTKVKAKPALVAAYAEAFPDAADTITGANVQLALGAFQRTLVTKSKFDAYLDGDQKALSNEEKQGLNDFMQLGCITCHTTRLLGGNMFQKTGLLAPYASADLGRGTLTGNDFDKHFFKVPSLLNVEHTAPYYHDGKVATLEEAVTSMAKLQLGKDLTAEQTASIVTFLKTLTGPLPAEPAAK